MLLPLPLVLLGGGSTGEGSSQRERVPLDSKHSSRWSPLAGKVPCPGRIPGNPSSDARPRAETPCSLLCPQHTCINRGDKGGPGQWGTSRPHRSKRDGRIWWTVTPQGTWSTVPPKDWSQPPVLPTSGCRANPIAREGHEGHQPLDVGEKLQLWVPPPAAGGDSQELPQFPSTQGPRKPSKTPYGQGVSHSQPALCAHPHTCRCPALWPQPSPWAYHQAPLSSSPAGIGMGQQWHGQSPRHGTSRTPNTLTKTQDGGGWKEPLETIQSNSLVKVRSPRICCAGSHTGGF